MSIKKVFCQDKAIRQLQSALTAGRLSHAYIFAGPEGVGKFKTAYEWAKVLLCNDKTGKDKAGFSDSCGECDSCRVFESGAHPDFKHIYKELITFTREGRNRKTPIDLPIDVLREFLIEKVALRPQLSDCSVYIISEAEKLNIQSQNALLKVLEEPPKHCYIILLCTMADRLLPTTRSRCQVLMFGQIDEEKIVEKLCELEVPKQQAVYWARFSQYSLGVASRWAKISSDGADCFKTKKELIRRLADYKLEDALEFAAWLGEQNREIAKAWAKEQSDTSASDINRRVQKGVLMMIITAFNDAMKLNSGLDRNLVNDDQIKDIRNLAGKSNAEESAEMIEKAYRAMGWVDANVNEKLIFEQLLLNYASSDII